MSVVSTSVHEIDRIEIEGHAEGGHRWLQVRFFGPEINDRRGQEQLTVSVHVARIRSPDAPHGIKIGDVEFDAFVDTGVTDKPL